MKQHLKITVGLLLLLQGFRTVLLENTTDFPLRRPTIPEAWLRRKPDFAVVGQNVKEDEMDEAGNVSGIPSGSMSISSGESGDQDSPQQDSNATTDEGFIMNTTVLPEFLNDTTQDSRPVETNETPTVPTNSSQINGTRAEEASQNTTVASPDAPIVTLNSTTSPSFSNETELHETTLAPVTNETRGGSGTDVDNRPSNRTEDRINATATEVVNELTTTASSTAELLPETTVDLNTMAPIAPTADNRTDKGLSSGSSSEKGFTSDYKPNARSQAWGAVLGTAVAVAIVGLVVYVILRRRNQRDFTHRKLVEEFSPDPVLRLDNSEPLDLNYGGAAYYNPGLQMDNIQMTNFPRGQNN